MKRVMKPSQRHEMAREAIGKHDSRDGLRIEVDFSLPAIRVKRALDQIIEWRGKPRQIRCDNGHEYISGLLATQAGERGIDLLVIQPGKPQQNAYIARKIRLVEPLSLYRN